MYDPKAYDSELNALLKLLKNWDSGTTETPAWSGVDLGVGSDSWVVAALPPRNPPKIDWLNRRAQSGGAQG